MCYVYFKVLLFHFQPIEFGGLGLDYKYQLAFLEATGYMYVSKHNMFGFNYTVLIEMN